MPSPILDRVAARLRFRNDLTDAERQQVLSRIANRLPPEDRATPEEIALSRRRNALRQDLAEGRLSQEQFERQFPGVGGAQEPAADPDAIHRQVGYGLQGLQQGAATVLHGGIGEFANWVPGLGEEARTGGLTPEEFARQVGPAEQRLRQAGELLGFTGAAMALGGATAIGQRAGAQALVRGGSVVAPGAVGSAARAAGRARGLVARTGTPEQIAALGRVSSVRLTAEQLMARGGAGGLAARAVAGGTGAAAEFGVLGALQRLPMGGESPFDPRLVAHDAMMGVTFGTSGVMGRQVRNMIAQGQQGLVRQIFARTGDTATAVGTAYGVARAGGANHEDALVEGAIFGMIHGISSFGELAMERGARSHAEMIAEVQRRVEDALWKEAEREGRTLPGERQTDQEVRDEIASVLEDVSQQLAEPRLYEALRQMRAGTHQPTPRARRASGADALAAERGQRVGGDIEATRPLTEAEAQARDTWPGAQPLTSRQARIRARAQARRAATTPPGTQAGPQDRPQPTAFDRERGRRPRPGDLPPTMALGPQPDLRPVSAPLRPSHGRGDRPDNVIIPPGVDILAPEQRRLAGENLEMAPGGPVAQRIETGATTRSQELDGMSLKGLRQIAEDRGLQVPGRANKATLIERILADERQETERRQRQTAEPSRSEGETIPPERDQERIAPAPEPAREGASMIEMARADVERQRAVEPAEPRVINSEADARVEAERLGIRFDGAEPEINTGRKIFPERYNFSDTSGAKPGEHPGSFGISKGESLETRLREFRQSFEKTSPAVPEPLPPPPPLRVAESSPAIPPPAPSPPASERGATSPTATPKPASGEPKSEKPTQQVRDLYRAARGEMMGADKRLDEAVIREFSERLERAMALPRNRDRIPVIQALRRDVRKAHRQAQRESPPAQPKQKPMTKVTERAIDTILDQVDRFGQVAGLSDVQSLKIKRDIEQRWSRITTHALKLGIQPGDPGVYFSAPRYKELLDRIVQEIEQKFGPHPTPKRQGFAAEKEAASQRALDRHANPPPPGKRERERIAREAEEASAKPEPEPEPRPEPKPETSARSGADQIRTPPPSASWETLRPASARVEGIEAWRAPALKSESYGVPKGRFSRPTPKLSKKTIDLAVRQFRVELRRRRRQQPGELVDISVELPGVERGAMRFVIEPEPAPRGRQLSDAERRKQKTKGLHPGSLDLAVDKYREFLLSIGSKPPKIAMGSNPKAKDVEKRDTPLPFTGKKADKGGYFPITNEKEERINAGGFWGDGTMIVRGRAPDGFYGKRGKAEAEEMARRVAQFSALPKDATPAEIAGHYGRDRYGEGSWRAAHDEHPKRVYNMAARHSQNAKKVKDRHVGGLTIFQTPDGKTTVLLDARKVMAVMDNFPNAVPHVSPKNDTPVHFVVDGQVVAVVQRYLPEEVRLKQVGEEGGLTVAEHVAKTTGVSIGDVRNTRRGFVDFSFLDRPADAVARALIGGGRTLRRLWNQIKSLFSTPKALYDRIRGDSEAVHAHEPGVLARILGRIWKAMMGPSGMEARLARRRGMARLAPEWQRENRKIRQAETRARREGFKEGRREGRRTERERQRAQAKEKREKAKEAKAAAKAERDAERAERDARIQEAQRMASAEAKKRADALQRRLGPKIGGIVNRIIPAWNRYVRDQFATMRSDAAKVDGRARFEIQRGRRLGERFAYKFSQVANDTLQRFGAKKFYLGEHGMSDFWFDRLRNLHVGLPKRIERLRRYIAEREARQAAGKEVDEEILNMVRRVVTDLGEQLAEYNAVHQGIQRNGEKRWEGLEGLAQEINDTLYEYGNMLLGMNVVQPNQMKSTLRHYLAQYRIPTGITPEPRPERRRGERKSETARAKPRQIRTEHMPAREIRDYINEMIRQQAAKEGVEFRPIDLDVARVTERTLRDEGALVGLTHLMTQIARPEMRMTSLVPAEGFRALSFSIDNIRSLNQRLGDIVENAYGPLRGLYVRNDMANVIDAFTASPSAMTRGYERLISFFKRNKTYRNPATQFRNLFSKMLVVNTLAGHPWWLPSTYRQMRTAWDAMHGRGDAAAIEHYREFVRSWGEGTFTSAEFAQHGLEAIRPPRNWGDYPRFVQGIATRLSAVDRAAQWLYHTVDFLPTASHYIEMRRQGMSAEKAYEHTAERFENYANVGPAVDWWSRKTGSFVRWPAEIGRILAGYGRRGARDLASGELTSGDAQALYLLGGMATALYSVNAWGADQLGLDDRDRQILRDYASPMHIIFPGADGQPVTLDLTYLIPFAEFAAIEGEDRAWSAVVQAGKQLVGGPPLMGIELLLNRSLFSGQDIAAASDPEAARNRQRALYAYRSMVPTFMGWGARTMFDIGRSDWQGRERRAGQVAAQYALGINLREQNMGRLRQLSRSRHERKVQAAERRRTDLRRRRDAGRTLPPGAPTEAEIQGRLQDLRLTR